MPFVEFLFVLISRYYYWRFQFSVDSAKHKKCFSQMNEVVDIFQLLHSPNTEIIIKQGFSLIHYHLFFEKKRTQMYTGSIFFHMHWQ